MAEQATSAGEAAGPAGEAEDAELREELAEARREILRLRDLLIAKDAEMGAMRGRLAELEDRSQRVTNAAARIQSRVPGLMRIGGAAVRRLQGRRS